jgi:hypothetical protein
MQVNAIQQRAAIFAMYRSICGTLQWHIGVHFPIGYTTFVHLAPAYLGAFMFVTGMILTFNKMVRGQ